MHQDTIERLVSTADRILKEMPGRDEGVNGYIFIATTDSGVSGVCLDIRPITAGILLSELCYAIREHAGKALKAGAHREGVDMIMGMMDRFEGVLAEFGFVRGEDEGSELQ
jgi:hypothetical protein